MKALILLFSFVFMSVSCVTANPESRGLSSDFEYSQCVKDCMLAQSQEEAKRCFEECWLKYSVMTP